MQHRLYSPGLGRFATQNSVFGSLSNPTSLNQFAYANASPTTFSDPSGRFTPAVPTTVVDEADQLAMLEEVWSFIPASVVEAAAPVGEASAVAGGTAAAEAGSTSVGFWAGIAGLAYWLGSIPELPTQTPVPSQGAPSPITPGQSEPAPVKPGISGPLPTQTGGASGGGGNPPPPAPPVASSPDYPEYSRGQYGRVPRLLRALVLEQNSTCVYCGQSISNTLDHIDALKQDYARGELWDDYSVRTARVNDPSNLTGACGPCNFAKQASVLGEGSGEWWPRAWPQGEWWPFGGGS